MSSLPSALGSRVIGGMLILALTVGAVRLDAHSGVPAGATSLEILATQLEPGTPIRVLLLDGGRVQGILESVTFEGLTVRTGRTAKSDGRFVPAQQVKAVQKVRSWRPGKKLAIVLVVAGAVAVVAVWWYLRGLAH